MRRSTSHTPGVLRAEGAQVPDCELVAAVAMGQADALGELHDRHRAMLLAAGRRILRDPSEAEDLLHDVLIEAWGQAGTYSAKRGSVRAWLLVRLRSRAFDRLRSPRWSKVTSIEVAPVDEAHLVARIPEPSAGLDAAAVQRCMSSLHADQRAVLDLAYFSGLSLSEVATQLDVPLGTIKSRLGRALRSLRRDLTSASAAEV